MISSDGMPSVRKLIGQADQIGLGGWPVTAITTAVVGRAQWRRSPPE